MPNKKIIVFILFAFGILFRSLYPTHYIFNFDQEQIAINATNIIKGNLTLIGPRVGPAEFFQPPLYYYLATPFYALGDYHPVSGTYLSIFLSAITGISLYLLFRKFESENQAIATLFMWSTSIFLISMDRTTWLVNLMVLSSSLVYFGLKNIRHKHSKFLVSLGLVLAFNAHLSSLLLAVITLYIYIKTKKPPKEFLALLLPAFIFAILPLILFDIRHDFMSAKGLVDFLFNRAGSAPTSILYQFTRSSITAIRLGGRLLVENTSIYTHMFAGGALLFYARRYLKDISSLTTTWVFTFIVVFGFYGGHLPEYYFLMLTPVYLDIYSRIWKASSMASMLLIVFGTYSLISGLSSQYSYPLTMQNKIDVVGKITDETGTKDMQIKLSLPRGDEYGFPYLIDHLGVTNKPTTAEYTIYGGEDMPNQVGGYHFIDSSNK